MQLDIFKDICCRLNDRRFTLCNYSTLDFTFSRGARRRFQLRWKKDELDCLVSFIHNGEDELTNIYLMESIRKVGEAKTIIMRIATETVPGGQGIQQHIDRQDMSLDFDWSLISGAIRKMSITFSDGNQVRYSRDIGYNNMIFRSSPDIQKRYNLPLKIVTSRDRHLLGYPIPDHCDAASAVEIFIAMTGLNQLLNR